MLNDRAASVLRLPALSGLLFVLAFYSGLLLPNLVLFVPLLLWLELAERASATTRMRAGFVFGLAAFVPSLHFHYAMLSFSRLAALLYVGMVLAFSLKTAVLVGLLGRLRSTTRWPWGLLLPLCWVPAEWLQSWGDLRMTGDHIGQSLAAFPWLVQFTDVLGPYGVSAALLAVNGLIFEALYGFYAADRRRAAAALAALVAAVLAYDAWAWTHHARRLETAETLRVGIVQPDVPIHVKRGEGTAVEQWQTLETLTRRAALEGPDLIVWPESARPWAVIHDLDRPGTYAMPEVQRLARELGVALLVGAEYARGRAGTPLEYYNAAVLVHADGRLDPTWTAKAYLVPFTEGVPFERVLGPLVRGRGGEWQWLAGGWTPGRRGVLLGLQVPDADPAATLPLAVMVCYEQFFPDLGRAFKNDGAALQIVITNDAWYGRSPFQRYLADMVRLRAIENRSSFVRAANTGYSELVDPLGRVLERTSLFEPAVLVGDVPLYTRRTVYGRIGDVVAWLALGGLALTWVWGTMDRARRRAGRAPGRLSSR